MKRVDRVCERKERGIYLGPQKIPAILFRLKEKRCPLSKYDLDKPPFCLKTPFSAKGREV